MLAVVDTNVLVSALMRSESLPAAVVSSIATQRLQPVLCNAVMTEYAAVLPRSRLRLNLADVRELLALIEQQAVWVDVPEYGGAPPLPDPADWPFIACALAVNCPVVTGNLKHFPVRLGVKAMTPREWLERDAQSGNA